MQLSRRALHREGEAIDDQQRAVVELQLGAGLPEAFAVRVEAGRFVLLESCGSRGAMR